MKAVVGTKAECDVLLGKVNAHLGYPKDGVDLPGGIHASPDASRTMRAVGLVQHPTSKTQWAVPVDDADVMATTDVKSATVVVLTADWTATPSPIVVAAVVDAS